MVERYAEQESVLFLHFFQTAAQREDKVQAGMVLHKVPEVVKDITFESPGPDFLIKADHLIDH